MRPPDMFGPTPSYDLEDRLEFEDGAPVPVALPSAPAIDEPTCIVCGCSNSRACPGGCIWAHENLCSRCAREGSR